jgi:hypothetical protein
MYAGSIDGSGNMPASVCRSDYNAAKRRSPTHLHLIVLRVQDGRVAPLDVYKDLKRARVFDKRS